ncbi:hypothetical protein Efla_005604 [Eimeria flavescens]
MLSLAASLAACVAACAAGLGSLPAAAFHLQRQPTAIKAAAAAFAFNSSPSSSPSPPPSSAATFTARGLPLLSQWSSAASKLQLPPAFAVGESGNLDREDSSVLAMASFLRCHKPLLNDRGPEIPDGNLCMLLRGCDAHQRMISPLELKTNAAALPGAAAALVMASKGPAAERALCEQQKEDLKASEDACNKVERVALLALEVGKLHRLLQYATAAGLKENFLSQDAMQVMLELYEVQLAALTTVWRGICLPAGGSEGQGESNRLASGYESALAGSRLFAAVAAAGNGPQERDDLQGLGRTQELLRAPALPAVEALFLFVHLMLLQPAEKVPVTSLPFEPPPDPRTLTPLVVNIMDFTDQLRESAVFRSR